MIHKSFNTIDIMKIIMSKSYNLNDNLRLYNNINYGIGSHNLNVVRVNGEDTSYFDEAKENTLEKLIKEAINRADYDDTYTIYRVFCASHNSQWTKNFDWKYCRETEHEYKWVEEAIYIRRKQLKEEGVDSWRKSKDKNKHKHFIWWINKFLDNNGKDKNEISKIRDIRLFVENDTRSFDTFSLCNNYHDEKIYTSVLNYILDNHIVPDSTCKDGIEIINPFENEMYNHRKLKSSSNEGGFWYTIYLTAEELQDIYKTKLLTYDKRIMCDKHKAVWAYINSLKSEYGSKTKFYLYIS